MALPMKNMTGSFFNNLSKKVEEFSCDDFVGVIEICLNLLPDDGNIKHVDNSGNEIDPAKDGTTRHLLKVKTTSDVVARDAASFVGMKFNTTLNGGSSAQIVIETIFSEWCEKNLYQFAHIFAILDLNDEIATGPWAFCKPHTAQYACVDKVDKTSGIIGLLCMTSDDPVPDGQQITNFAIPDGSDAGFLISSRRFIKDLVTPALVKTWPDIKGEMLELSSDNKALKLKSGISVDLPNIKTNDNDIYTPSLKAFTFEVQVDVLNITMHTEVEVSPGIYATCSATYWYSLSLGENENGEQTIVYQQQHDPVITHGKRTDEGIVILNDVLQVIAVVAGVLACLLYTSPSPRD